MDNPGALLFPLLLWLNRRKKNGKGVYKTDLFLLGMFFVIGLSACQEGEDSGGVTTPITVQPASTEIAQASLQPSATSTPTATQPPPTNTTAPTLSLTSTPTVAVILCPTPTPTNTPNDMPVPTGTPTPTPTPSPPPQPPGIAQGTWDTYLNLWHELKDGDPPYLLADGRIDDQYLMAILIEIAQSLREGSGRVFRAALEAVSYRYRVHCNGGCSTLQDQMEFMNSMENWRVRNGRPLPNISNDCISSCWDNAALAIDGYNDGDGFQAVWWANPIRNSEMHNYIVANFPADSYGTYDLIEDNKRFIIGFRGTDYGGEGGVLHFIVVTQEQNNACDFTCMGFSSP
jgi:hypothetical protein